MICYWLMLKGKCKRERGGYVLVCWSREVEELRKASLRGHLYAKTQRKYENIHNIIKEYYRKGEMGKEMLWGRDVPGECLEQLGGQWGQKSTQKSESPTRCGHRGERIGQRYRQGLLASGKGRLIFTLRWEVRERLWAARWYISIFALTGSLCSGVKHRLC